MLQDPHRCIVGTFKFHFRIRWFKGVTEHINLLGLEPSWYTWDPNLILSLAKLPVGTCHLRLNPDRCRLCTLHDDE